MRADTRKNGATIKQNRKEHRRRRRDISGSRGAKCKILKEANREREIEESA